MTLSLKDKETFASCFVKIKLIVLLSRVLTECLYIIESCWSYPGVEDDIRPIEPGEPKYSLIDVQQGSQTPPPESYVPRCTRSSPRPNLQLTLQVALG